jgi:hypothetical protein
MRPNLDSTGARTPPLSKCRGWLVAGVVVGGVVLLGCSGGAPSPERARVDSSASTTSGTASSAAPKQMPKVGSGEGYKYDDGLRVQVTAAKRFTIGEWSVGGQPGQVGVKVNVKVTNGTGNAIDLDLTSVNLSYGADGMKADNVIDSGLGLSGGFTGKVAPGRNASAWYGFAIDKGGLGQIDVEVQPGMNYPGVLFSGSVR